jgi:hypothetical protein
MTDDVIVVIANELFYYYLLQISTMSLKPSWSRLTASLSEAPEGSLAAAGLVGTVTAIQLCTDWNPVGRSFTFWKQLRGHVSKRWS